MKDLILETKDLCKTFKKQQVVQDISLKVKRNSIYGLLGSNGAGKSTTLKMITGMLRPTSGEIFFENKLWSRKSLSSIGALVESAPLYENLTARENLKVRTTILGLPDERIEKVLHAVDLEGTGKIGGYMEVLSIGFPLIISIISAMAVEQEKALASEKNIELINEQETIPEFFYGDDELLYRAIMNIIVNAVEYSPKNGKLLFKVKATNNDLQFLIEDSGKGFSKEDLEFATEQFYRGDRSRNSKNHYGIGLSITKSFVKLHHGNIEVSNSTKFGGAQVVLKVPLNVKNI